MKIIGLLGGMSWESTATYYRLINQQTRIRLGGHHSAELVLWSFDFSRIELLAAQREWDEACNLLMQPALKLQAAGAECIVICSNTMHVAATHLQQGLGIPVMHIAEATASAIQKANCKKPLLLATRSIIEQGFYEKRLQQIHGTTMILPDKGGQAVVHDIVYHELCRGQVNEESRRTLLQIVRKAQDQGADGVILACSELGNLVGQKDISVPVIDSTEEHVRGILDFALKRESEFEELI